MGCRGTFILVMDKLLRRILARHLQIARKHGGGNNSDGSVCYGVCYLWMST